MENVPGERGEENVGFETGERERQGRKREGGILVYNFLLNFRKESFFVDIFISLKVSKLCF